MKFFNYSKDVTKLLDYIAGITEDMMEYDGENDLDSYTTNFFGEDVLFDFEEGCSKKVIVFSDLGFVIKFDNCGDSEREVDLYNAAVDYGLADCFPTTRLLCYHNGYQWVYQEIANAFYFSRKQSEEKAKQLKVNEEALEMIWNITNDISNCTRTDCLSKVWLKIAINYFGYSHIGKLARFIQTNRINDLHNGNVGFVKDRPVLIDFCGYNWDTEYYGYNVFYDSESNSDED